jgi:hypothetical protein
LGARRRSTSTAPGAAAALETVRGTMSARAGNSAWPARRERSAPLGRRMRRPPPASGEAVSPPWAPRTGRCQIPDVVPKWLPIQTLPGPALD